MILYNFKYCLIEVTVMMIIVISVIIVECYYNVK